MDRATRLTSSRRRSVTFSHEQGRCVPRGRDQNCAVACGRPGQGVGPARQAVQRPLVSRPGGYGWSGPARGLRTSLRTREPVPHRKDSLRRSPHRRDVAEQVAQLCAGMETRAYRLNLSRRTLMFEVDHAGIFTAKNAVLEASTAGAGAGRSTPTSPGIGNQPSWTRASTPHGAPCGWPRVCFFYLPEDAVRQLLCTVGRLCRARGLFSADIFGNGLLRLPSMQPFIDQRRGSNQPLPFCTDQPGELLAAVGWRADTLVHPGQPRAKFGRLPAVQADWDGGPDPMRCTHLAVGSRHD